MASKPKILEKHVKNQVKKVLANSERYGYIYSNWPVPAGYGSPTLDCFGSINGKFFAVETKAPGKVPTPRQEVTIRDMEMSGAKVFVIDHPDAMLPLEEWLSDAGRTGTIRPGGVITPV